MEDGKGAGALSRCQHHRQQNPHDVKERLPCATPQCSEGVRGEYLERVIWPAISTIHEVPPNMELRKVLFVREEQRIGGTELRCFTWKEAP